MAFEKLTVARFSFISVVSLLVSLLLLQMSSDGPRVLASRDKDAKELDILHEDSQGVVLQARLKGPLAPDDPQLLQFVRERYLLPPSEEPYNLTLNAEEEKGHTGTSNYNLYRYTFDSWMFVDRVLKVLFQHEQPGFFVEAGALDGEYISNTLRLETKLKWKGLLVEANSDMFTKLKKKNRKAWASNTCLATSPYPYRTILVKVSSYGPKHGDFRLLIKGHSALMESLESRQTQYGSLHQSVQCLPLQTLLLALNVTHVNFVSLDVEGVEMGILESFIGTSGISVDVWAVEHRHPRLLPKRPDKVDNDFIYWFESNGYTLYTRGIYSPIDYIFIRNGSAIYEKSFALRPDEFIVN